MASVISGLPFTVGRAVAPGSAAGEHKVDGNIAPGDTLLAVLQVSDDLQTVDDLTSEFSITDYGVIDNDGGTDTTGDFLVVVYAKAEEDS